MLTCYDIGFVEFSQYVSYILITWEFECQY